MMKQTISKFEIGAIIGSFVGILMISLGKPEDGGADSHRISQLTGTFYSWLGINGVYVLGIVVAGSCAFMFASVGLITRELKQIHFSVLMFDYSIILIAFSVILQLLSLLIASAQGEDFKWPFVFDSWFPYVEVLFEGACT